MSTNRIHIGVAPGKVFDFLCDGERYADWVVGAKRVRDVDPNWPQVGSKLYHTVGIGPLKLRDNTEVASVHAPSRLVLEAKARPLGRARVELSVRLDRDGTRLVMQERPLGVPRVVAKLLDPLIYIRNLEALRRLRKLCERREGCPG